LNRIQAVDFFLSHPPEGDGEGAFGGEQLPALEGMDDEMRRAVVASMREQQQEPEEQQQQQQQGAAPQGTGRLGPYVMAARQQSYAAARWRRPTQVGCRVRIRELHR
jgi:hypothetical protein